MALTGLHRVSQGPMSYILNANLPRDCMPLGYIIWTQVSNLKQECLVMRCISWETIKDKEWHGITRKVAGKSVHAKSQSPLPSQDNV